LVVVWGLRLRIEQLIVYLSIVHGLVQDRNERNIGIGDLEVGDGLEIAGAEVSSVGGIGSGNTSDHTCLYLKSGQGLHDVVSSGQIIPHPFADTECSLVCCMFRLRRHTASITLSEFVKPDACVGLLSVNLCQVVSPD
jgi:hypothetical protein